MPLTTPVNEAVADGTVHVYIVLAGTICVGLLSVIATVNGV